MTDEAASGPERTAESELVVPGGTRARAEECLLVLASQGIAAAVRPGARGYAVIVRAADRAPAEAALAAYRRENRGGAAAGVLPVEPEPVGAPGTAGVIVAFLLLAAHALAGRSAVREIVYERGSADAAAILAGEWWRTVSALFLHADIGHVVGNALFGVYFVTAVTRSLGAGLGLALVLAAGALGNGLNALGHGGDHDSIGASTAVFGAIGILAGIALARRNRSGLRGARLLLPVGAGLGLLAMLGTSGARVDFLAHLYGLLAGGLLGIAAGLGVRRRPGLAAQSASALAAAAVVAFAFVRVLRP